MDKTTERETHDFMNVDSFSQLPFIRPAPSIKEKNGIRLFGIEFTDKNDTTTEDTESTETTTNNNNINPFDLDTTNKDNPINTTATETNGESSRRFECHYCCRNFPTSQALGGHQNAHKRERQHAKRAHLQSTMVHGSTFSDTHHMYNLMNYRFNSMPYPTWNSTTTNSTNTNINTNRFYGTTSFSHNHHHQQQQQQQQPINGSPLPFWRIPSGASNPNSFNHERSLPPLFGSDEINNVRTSQVVVGASGSQNRFVYDPKRGAVQDHVSLDLHL